MKELKTYIAEAFKINKNTKLESRYKYFPKNKNELRDIIHKLIEAEGKKCNLNDIDVSEIKDMSFLFYNSRFDGDISEWKVSNVEDMVFMFGDSDFNQDISNWDVSNVTEYYEIFYDCPIEEKYKPTKFK